MTKRIVSGVFIIVAIGALGLILPGALTNGDQLIVRFLIAVVVAAVGLYLISDLRLQSNNKKAAAAKSGRNGRIVRNTPAPQQSTAAFMATVTRKRPASGPHTAGRSQYQPQTIDLRYASPPRVNRSPGELTHSRELPPTPTSPSGPAADTTLADITSTHPASPQPDNERRVPPTAPSQRVAPSPVFTDTGDLPDYLFNTTQITPQRHNRDRSSTTGEPTLILTTRVLAGAMGDDTTGFKMAEINPDYAPETSDEGDTAEEDATPVLQVAIQSQEIPVSLLPVVTEKASPPHPPYPPRPTDIRNHRITKPAAEATQDHTGELLAFRPPSTPVAPSAPTSEPAIVREQAEQIAPIIRLDRSQAAALAGDIDAAIQAGEMEVISSLIDEGLLSNEGPILDEDVKAMVYVAFTSNELRKILRSGGTIDGDNSDLDLGAVEVFYDTPASPPLPTNPSTARWQSQAL